MSKDESRLLVVHGDSTNHYPPRHRVAILDSMSLRTIAQLPLGDCNFLDLRPLPEHVTMLCQQSQDPGDKNKKKTFALVTLDLNRARVARWFDLGGERRGIWVGPMFFGYYDLTLALDVKTEGYLTFQLRVGRPIHLAHPAFADRRGDFIDTEPGTRSEGQIATIIRARLEIK